MSIENPGRKNPFLTGDLMPLFARTAAPIILMMSINGVQTLIDAWFLGAYVGADALAAVTLMFPAYMLMVALSSLVSTGMASVLARTLGAEDLPRARATLSGAHGLCLVMCACLITAFALGGAKLAGILADGEAGLAQMGHDYISVIVWCSPIMFLLGVNGDALRCEGRLALMAATTFVVTGANIAFTWLLVVRLGYGVQGSAVGTVLAQSLALLIVVAYRFGGPTSLRWQMLKTADMGHGWRQFLALGAPQSLSFIGISLVSGAMILSVQRWGGENYAATVAAYGIITRLMTFAYMPLMGLNMATQTIVGNNLGARLYSRSDAALLIGLTAAIVYTATFELTMYVSAASIGRLFVDDPATIAEIGRILPVSIMLYVVSGGLLIVSGYLQAIGDARTAILLTVGRIYVFTIPLVVLLPHAAGEIGIWIAGPVSEAMTLLLAGLLLRRNRQQKGLKFGLLHGKAATADG